MTPVILSSPIVAPATIADHWRPYLDWADRRRLWLFPVYAHSKLPANKWKTESSPDRADWEGWIAEGHQLGINAFKSGKILLDLDIGKVGQDMALKAFGEFLAEMGSGWIAPYGKSPSGGYHFMVDRPAGYDPEQMQGLWKPRMTSDARPLADGEKDAELISVRNRGYCVAPGSQFGKGSYLLTDAADLRHACPPALLEKLKLPEVQHQATGEAGQSDQNDLAAVVAALDALDYFDDEQKWKFNGIGAIKLALGDTEEGQTVAMQITWADVSYAEFLFQWNRMDAVEKPGKKYLRVGTLIRDAEKLTGRKFHVGKSAVAMFNGVAQFAAAAAPSIVPDLPPLPYGEGAPKKLIQSSGEFVAGFVAPSFLIDGVIQKQNVYALTAAPGTGKTAIALRLAAHVALGRKLGDRDVERGRVLYFAAENYVDVQARLIAMAEHCGFDVNTIDIYFVPGNPKLSEIADRIKKEAQALGDLTLVIVDTSAATFEGSDENSNVDGLAHAKRMRSLTELRGKPTVLVLCHPVKSATHDNLLPRGGSAFFGEIDGNLCVRKTDSAVEMHWFGKIRGMDFNPMAFRLDTVVATPLKDARGRNMPTVLATPIDDAAKQVLAASERSDQDRVLHAIYEHPGQSSNDIAKHLGWAMRDGKPYGMRVRRACERMAGDGLVLKHRGEWVLSPRGEKELNRLERVPSGTSAVPVLPPFPPRILQ